MIAGHVLLATGNDESGEQFFEPTILNPSQEQKKAVREDLLEKLGIVGDVQVIIVTHHR